MQNTVYLGIGSNQGDKYFQCEQAIEALCASPENLLLERSSFYLTEPWGYSEQDDFINLAVKIQTSLTPLELLSYTKQVELEGGKIETCKWGPRAIDIDILFYNDHTIALPVLTIPHPYLHQRAFVLHPLHEIAPRLMHPVFHKTIAELCACLNDSKWVLKLSREKS